MEKPKLLRVDEIYNILQNSSDMYDEFNDFSVEKIVISMISIKYYFCEDNIKEKINNKIVSVLSFIDTENSKLNFKMKDIDILFKCVDGVQYTLSGNIDSTGLNFLCENKIYDSIFYSNHDIINGNKFISEYLDKFNLFNREFIGSDFRQRVNSIVGEKIQNKILNTLFTYKELNKISSRQKEAFDVLVNEFSYLKFNTIEEFLLAGIRQKLHCILSKRISSYINKCNSINVSVFSDEEKLIDDFLESADYHILTYLDTCISTKNPNLKYVDLLGLSDNYSDYFSLLQQIRAYNLLISEIHLEIMRHTGYSESMVIENDITKVSIRCSDINCRSEDMIFNETSIKVKYIDYLEYGEINYLRLNSDFNISDIENLTIYSENLQPFKVSKYYLDTLRKISDEILLLLENNTYLISCI